jgi:hypothetical protein
MNIIGLDALVFGVDDLGAAAQYLRDYGLIDAGGGRFEALDGTAVVIAPENDASLPKAPTPGCRLRKTLMGVADAAAVEAIAPNFVMTARSGTCRRVHRVGRRGRLRHRLPGQRAAPARAGGRGLERTGLADPAAGERQRCRCARAADPPAEPVARRVLRARCGEV